MLGAKRVAGAHGEDLRGRADQAPGVLGDERCHLGPIAVVGKDVDLVDHHHHLLAPIADLLEEGTLGLGERPVGGGDEEHEIGARHEARRQALVLADDGVGPGSVDDVNLAQQVGRGVDRRQVGLED